MRTAALICLMTLPLAVFSQGISRCDIGHLDGGQFKTVNESQSIIEGRRTLFLKLRLSPSKFNDRELRSIALRIKTLYCNEEVINVEFWDRSDKRKFDDLTPPPIYSPQTRALYYIDRSAKLEKLRYYKNGKEGPDVALKE